MIELSELLSKFEGVKRRGSGHQARCSARGHEDQKASLSIALGRKGIVLHCHAGCKLRDILDPIGIEEKDLFHEPFEKKNGKAPSAKKPKKYIEATYDYLDETGELRFQVVRYNTKEFPQRRPDPDKPGEWLWNLEGVVRIPYQLPALMKADPGSVVYIAEGEKDVLNLMAMGFTATCNPGGAGKWRNEYSLFLSGHKVVILPDNDRAGEEHADQVYRSILEFASQAEVRILRLPDLPPKGDATDWMDAGGTPEDLRRMTEYAFESPPEEEVAPAETTEPRYWRRTQEGLADEFLRRYGADFRFLTDLSKDLRPDAFVAWMGGKWVMGAPAVVHLGERMRAMTKEFRDMAQDMLRAVGGYMEGADKDTKDAVNFSKTIEGAAFKTGWKQEMKAFAHLSQQIGDFDQRPHLFGCRNGIIDLQTGELFAPRRDFLMTKASPVRYEPAAQCPTWEKFLNQVFLEDQELILFIQRAVGYSLTGDAREQCLFLCHGNGSNGKSTFLNQIRHIAGQYSLSAPTKTFLDKKVDTGTSNDLAMLRGARLVTAVELNEGQRLDEALVKSVTGQDPISARHLHQEFFEFTPVFKLWLGVNHAPEIRGGDEGIWRRMRKIPFLAQFSGDQKDPDLGAKLRAESPGILAWAVRGAIDWYKAGLTPPSAVLQATQEYREEQDVFGQFLDEEVELDPNARVPADMLYQAYVRWTERLGNKYPISVQAFGRKLTDRGFGKLKSHGSMLRTGLNLKSL